MPSYRVWAGSLLHPESRLLPGLGARLPPRPAGAFLAALRALPTRRLRAWAHWHVARPLVQRMSRELVVRAVGGVRIIADPAETSGRTLATTGLWEWNVGTAIRQALKPGDVCVDAGANTGYYSALAAVSVGPTGHVYALEPGPDTYRRLLRNLELNGLGNVTALSAAAGAAEGRATLYGPADGHDATSSLRRPEAGALATEVEVLPLHAVIRAEHVERLRLVKIDVEGHEDDVLRGLEPLLDRGARPSLLVEVHAAYNPDAPAFVVEFCERRRLRARWLVEDEGIDDHLAPADRRLVLRDLGSPVDLERIPRNRYALLLEPRP